MKCLYINLNILRETLRLNKDNIKAAFIDHCMYRNGLIVSVLSKKKYQFILQDILKEFYIF